MAVGLLEVREPSGCGKGGVCDWDGEGPENVCPRVRPGVSRGSVCEGRVGLVKEDELRVRLLDGRSSWGLVNDVRTDSLILFSVSTPVWLIVQLLMALVSGFRVRTVSSLHAIML